MDRPVSKAVLECMDIAAIEAAGENDGRAGHCHTKVENRGIGAAWGNRQHQRDQPGTEGISHTINTNVDK